ncbi:MAG TPA: dTDP-glucose 4,6-dehydratase [Desulfurivibrionaceae bacterium]|nr:dTDP-glucose 4,6-dehydratase [Desulfurivibrionaceae bacterium]
MARLLVTGGAGFIGANFVHYWLGRHPEDRLVVLDLLTSAGNRASLAAAERNPAFRFVQGDIGNQELVERLLREEGLDTIVNFAAESHVDRSIHGPDPFVQTNIVGTHALLKAARAVWLDASFAGRPHRFHHVSTDEVYGSLGPQDAPFTEATPYAPNSPYSASKAAADHLVRAYHHTYGLQTTTSNCSNNYGPYQFPEKLIPLVLLNILHGKPLPIYGDGQNIRDWLYVEDHCQGIERVLLQGKPGEVYNIGGNNEWTNIDIVRHICHLLDERFSAEPRLRERYPDCPGAQGEKAESLITFVADRPGHDRRYAIDAAKITAELGYRPQESFETGIAKTVAWYLANEPWWQGVMDGSYRQWLETQYGG